MQREYTLRIEREADDRIVTSLTANGHGFGLTSHADTQEDALGILGMLLDQITAERPAPAASPEPLEAFLPTDIEVLLRQAINRGESVYVSGTKVDNTTYTNRLIKPKRIWYGECGGTYIGFIGESGGPRTLLIDRMSHARIA